VSDILDRLHLPFESRLPAFEGATTWLNSEPLTPESLRGRVALVDFGTFTCINWIRTLPYVRAWNETYAAHGLATIGVQTPEFELERNLDSVRRSLAAMDVAYPVVVDNHFRIWDAFANRYWPALYLADHNGRIRYHHFGEGRYDETELAIQRLLRDAGARDVPSDGVAVVPEGIEIEGDPHNDRSPETYIGWARAEGFVSPGGAVADDPHDYSVPNGLRRNQWALTGNWTIGREQAMTNEPGARLVLRFHARDVNLIIAPTSSSAPVRVRVQLDGQRPDDAHGIDTDADGNGIVIEPRLHQLIRQRGSIEDKEIEIEFLDPGAAALCFTFG